MAEKKQLNVRIPLELQEKIDNEGRPKVDIVIDALHLYFDSKEHLKASRNDSNSSENDITRDSNDDNNDISSNIDDIKRDSNISKTDPIHSTEIARMKNEIEYLRSKLDDVIKLLHQEQVLHIQTQRTLMSPEKPPAEKKWWQFWK